MAIVIQDFNFSAFFPSIRLCKCGRVGPINQSANAAGSEDPALPLVQSISIDPKGVEDGSNRSGSE